MKDQPKQKSEQQVFKEFWDEYQALCEKHQCQIIVNPAYKARDDGTWSLVLQPRVGRMPKK